MPEYIKIKDFVVLEQAMLDEFLERIKPHIPADMVITRPGWEDLFLFYKAACASAMPEFAFRRQLQKLIGGWYSKGAIYGAPDTEALHDRG